MIFINKARRLYGTFRRLQARMPIWHRARRRFNPEGSFDVGCGPSPAPNHIGCDTRALPEVSIVCRAWELSRFTKQATRVYSRHTLEHLTLGELRLTLEDWHRALRKNGEIEVIVPNLDFHITQWQRAVWSADELSRNKSDARYALAGFYGWQRECDPKERNYNQSYWDVHKMGFSAKSLRYFLMEAGFTDVECHTEDSVHLVAKARKTVIKDERQVAPSLSGIRVDHLNRYLFAATKAKSAKQALDIACGIGYGSFVLSQELPDLKIHAVDIDAEAIRYANEHYTAPNITFAQKSLSETRLPGSAFDLVVAFEIMEHLQDPKELFALASKALAPGGKIILSTPNKEIEPFSPKKFPFHVRHYSSREIEEMISAFGLQITETHSQKDRTDGVVTKGSEGVFLLLTIERKP